MMKPELQNGKMWKTITPKNFKRLEPHNFSYQNIWQIWYEHRHVRDGWFRFMIFFMALYYDNILWWNLWWHIMMKYYEILWFEFVMMDDDEMMWDDDVWNDVVLFCVDTVMKWYEMLWKWNVVNDDMMEVDGMNLGVFVSSYMYNII